MVGRAILLVASIFASGLGQHAEAAVLTNGTSAVFAVDLPDLPPEATVWGSQGVGIGCYTGPCASVLNWPLDPDSPFERSAPPAGIHVKVGSGPGLSDLGLFNASNNYYPYQGPLFIEFGYGMELPGSVDTLYLTFYESVFEYGSASTAFYIMDYVKFEFWWMADRDDPGLGSGWTTLQGRPYEPVSNVPLPASLLLILSSLGACTVPAMRKRLRGQA